jgi:hypothetical protein
VVRARACGSKDRRFESQVGLGIFQNGFTDLADLLSLFPVLLDWVIKGGGGHMTMVRKSRVIPVDVSENHKKYLAP